MSSIRCAFTVGAPALLLAALSAEPARAMGQEAFGPAGPHISRSSDWPRGVEDMMRHPARVYWSWVNGNEHAYYDADIAKINELLKRFAQMDLEAHHVAVRPGRAMTSSFEGLVVEYNVEFQVPGGIYLHHVRSMAATGLYLTSPSLTIHFDGELVRHLDKLIVPENVTLQPEFFRVEDALGHIDSKDNSLRWRAVTLLGELGVSSAVVVEKLNQIAKDENANLQAAARKSLTQIEQANQPDGRGVREQIASMLLNHPQRLRVPRPGEVLAAMRKTDARYARGFTAQGTMAVTALSGRDQIIAWTVTMGDQKLVIQQKAAELPGQPPAEDLLERTYYVSPEQMGTIHRSRLWVDGQLIETRPHATFEPVGSTYDLLIGRVLWPIGRDFTRRIDEISEVTMRADGTLAVKAASNVGNLPWRWELVVDPQADYLVRWAKSFRRDDESPGNIIENWGVFSADSRSTAHIAQCREGSLAQPTSMSVTSVSAATNSELIRQTEERLAELKAQSQ